MENDIRYPIGLFFAVLGVILTIFGLATLNNIALYERSLGINLNLWTGLFMIAFSLFMLAGRRKKK